MILKRIQTSYIQSKLMYATPNNSFYKDMYSAFGLTEALVHPELYNRLIRLEKQLNEKQLILVIYDAFRPLAVQKFMYETAPDYIKPYIAPPPQPDSRRGFHPRGVAIDCYLANRVGEPLPFPTLPDAFYPGYEKDPNYPQYLKKCHRDYNSPDLTDAQKDNRTLLEDMMASVGLEGLPHEWWHFNLPNAWKYPLIESLKDVEIK
ncbi:MAG: hypothetical protein IKS41_05475 [Alphaproteobacteria bacterium]|nr:hypothetical protein [Alphaproteobacteria bacterium]